MKFYSRIFSKSCFKYSYFVLFILETFESFNPRISQKCSSILTKLFASWHQSVAMPLLILLLSLVLFYLKQKESNYLLFFLLSNFRFKIFSLFILLSVNIFYQLKFYAIIICHFLTEQKRREKRGFKHNKHIRQTEQFLKFKFPVYLSLKQN